MLDEGVLNLLGCDILALADDQVLGSTCDHQTPLGTPPAQVARTVEAPGVKGVRLVLGMEIARHHLRAASADLPVLCDDDVRIAWSTVRLGRKVKFVPPWGPDSRDRHLGRTIDPGDRRLIEPCRRFADKGGRHRGAATYEDLEVGQAIVRGARRRQHLIKEGRRAGHVGALAKPRQAHRFNRVPTIHQDRRGAQKDRRLEGVERAPYMAYRRGHEKDVARRNAPMLADLSRQGVQAIVSVQDALGPARRPGCIEDHLHGVGVQGRQGHARLALDQDLEREVRT
ncbi:hypothetical protein D3C72_1279910 [compost metagenome]